MKSETGSPDIEGRNSCDTSLAIGSERLDLVLAEAPLILWAIDRDGVFTLAEGKYLDIFGFQPGPRVGQSAYDVFGKIPEFVDNIRQAMKGRIANTVNKIDGLYFETCYTPVEDKQGYCTGLIGVSIDVTDHIRAEGTRRELNNILEATSDLIAMDDGQNIVYMNRAGQRLLGYESFGVARMPVAKFYPDWAYKLICEEGIPAAREKGVWSGETAFLHIDGYEIATSQVIIAHQSEGGTSRYLSTIARDIRETKNTEKRLREAKEKAEAAARSKSEFLTNMSHEIRTPLNAILGFADLLARNNPDPSIKNYVDGITLSGKNLLQLISDILDLSKIEADKLELRLQPVSPRDVLEEIRTLFTLQCEDKKLEFQIEVDPELHHTLMLDAIRLRQVLFNLVGNAIRYTPAGFVKVTARQENYDHENGLLDLILKVEDSGVGISEKDRTTIFDSFTQGHNGNLPSTGGTGLGLAITRRLVALMNGEIDLQSELDRGSSFSVRLRRVAITSLAAAGTATAIEPDEPVDFHNATILFVDDSEIDIEVMRGFTDGAQLHVIAASNGRECLELAGRYQPGVILLDLKMEGLDGYETTRRLKADPNLRHIPVIAITACSQSIEEERARQAGCNSFLRKPVSRRELVRELRRFLKPGNAPTRPLFVADGRHEETDLDTSELDSALIDLEGELMDHWKRVRDTFIVRDIKEFGERVSKLYSSCRWSGLGNFADDLARHVKNYDFDGIARTLEVYPSLIAKIKALIEP